MSTFSEGLSAESCDHMPSVQAKASKNKRKALPLAANGSRGHSRERVAAKVHLRDRAKVLARAICRQPIVCPPSDGNYFPL